MKIIRITTDNEISIHDFPDGTHSEQNKTLRELIGPTCDLYEHVMPRRLYTYLNGSNRPTKAPGSCVNMLIDKEGLCKELPQNLIGSWLYESDIHKCYIVGNILIAGEMWTPDGLEICGISDQQFAILYPRLVELANEAKQVEKERMEV